MFDNDNLYVLNKKDRNALIYRDSMGNISRLTRNMFDSDEEFEYWKKWSDEDYHDEEKEDRILLAYQKGVFRGQGYWPRNAHHG